MAEVVGVEDWHPARLIPVAGIRGQEEQEARATSAFLAVLSAVPAFSHSLLAELGAPRGQVQTFTEVRLKDPDGRVGRPDGAIIATRGSRTWTALVEVKTGANALTAEQTSRYLDLARDHGFDAVLTISNQITGRTQDSPVAVDRRKVRSVKLYHLSWRRIITTAVMEHRYRGVSDLDQAWILDQLISYVDHPKSGASGFQDMGGQWVTVRDAARQGTLRAGDAGARSVVEHWEQLLDYLALGLSQELGREVTPGRGRKETVLDRVEQHVRRLAETGELVGSLRVPNAVAPITIVANLRTRQLTTSVQLAAPGEGRQPTRVKWLLRQLPDGDARLRLSAYYANTRETGSALLGEVKEQPQWLLSPTDAKREIKAFEVALTRVLGQKNGRGAGSFIEESRSQLLDFYGEVVQNLTPWVARAPRLPETDEAAISAPGDDEAISGESMESAVVDADEPESGEPTSAGMVAGASYPSVPPSVGASPEPESSQDS
jgi:hypothetical protein